MNIFKIKALFLHTYTYSKNKKKTKKKMIQILAPVDNIRFDIEDALDKQTYATVPLPFTGIDSMKHHNLTHFICLLFYLM